MICQYSDKVLNVIYVVCICTNVLNICMSNQYNLVFVTDIQHLCIIKSIFNYMW